jgi:superfamily II DNA helicase RecQ
VTAAAATRTIQSLFRRLEVSWFKVTCRVSAPSNDALPCAYTSINNAAASTANFSFHLSTYAQHVFGVSSLHPHQVESATIIIFEEDCYERLLVVDRTGGGKSLVLQTVATCVGVITLVIGSLLSLTDNQLSRLKSANQDHGLVKAVHLDKTPDALVRSSLMSKMEEITGDGSETLVLFCLPQYSVEHDVFRGALLWGHQQRTLRLMSINKAHVYSMHGRSFRGCIRVF